MSGNVSERITGVLGFLVCSSPLCWRHTYQLHLCI